MGSYVLIDYHRLKRVLGGKGNKDKKNQKKKLNKIQVRVS